MKEAKEIISYNVMYYILADSSLKVIPKQLPRSARSATKRVAGGNGQIFITQQIILLKKLEFATGFELEWEEIHLSLTLYPHSDLTNIIVLGN